MYSLNYHNSFKYFQGKMILSSEKYDVQVYAKSLFEFKMTLIVRNFQKEDVGSYICIAKNSLGDVESGIRLYGERRQKAYNNQSLLQYSLKLYTLNINTLLKKT